MTSFYWADTIKKRFPAAPYKHTWIEAKADDTSDLIFVLINYYPTEHSAQYELPFYHGPRSFFFMCCETRYIYSLIYQ